MMKVASWAAVCLSSVTSLVEAASLDDVAAVMDRTSHRASSADPTGGNDDSVVSFAPQSAQVMLDVDGPGRITHWWMTVAGFTNHEFGLRDLVIRMYWENSPVPSVEVPLCDFFAVGPGKRYTVQSAPIVVGSNPKAFNCYWPMPFYKHARMEVYNNGDRSIRRVYYNVNYELGPIAEGQGLFHALYRREKELKTQPHARNLSGAENYVILETTGRGQYVGCVLEVDAQPGGWWGEGDEMMFIDHADRPNIIGTGSEDYFCNAWGFSEAFSYPFYGAPLVEKRADGGSFTTVYRWHIPDPVRFSKHIQVTIEHLFGPKTVNDYTSVAYWYQTEPIKERPPLPQGAANHPRRYVQASQPAPAAFEFNGTEFEAGLRAAGVKARSMTANIHDGYEQGGWLQVETGGKAVDIRIPVPEDGLYRVQVKPVNHLIEGAVGVGLKGGRTAKVEKSTAKQHQVPYLDLGEVAAADKTLTLVVDGNPVIGLDHLKIRKVSK